LKKIRRLGQLQNLLVQADVNWSVGTFLLVTCGISAVLMSLGFFKLGNLGALGGVALGLVLPFQFLKFKRKMRLRKFEKQLPEALDLLSRSLRAGHAFAAGLQLVAEEMANPLGMEFFKVFKEYNHGLDINTSLLNLCQRLELQELRFFTTAVIIQRETGGNLTDILEKISTLIRERFKLLNHIKALTAEGRMSGLVLILLPPGLAMMMLKINPKYIMLLVNTEIGRIMAMLAFGLQVLGIFAIHKIVNIKV
jgi:tight adherence protein B